MCIRDRISGVTQFCLQDGRTPHPNGDKKVSEVNSLNVKIYTYFCLFTSITWLFLIVFELPIVVLVKHKTATDIRVHADNNLQFVFTLLTAVTTNMAIN